MLYAPLRNSLDGEEGDDNDDDDYETLQPHIPSHSNMMEKVKVINGSANFATRQRAPFLEENATATTDSFKKL